MKLFKKILFLSLVIIICIISYSYADTATVNIEATRIRKEKNTTSEILTVIYEDDEVEVLEKGQEWTKIKYEDFTGYVKTEFLKLDNNSNTNNKPDENQASNNADNNSNNNSNNNQSNSNNEANNNSEEQEPLAENEIIVTSEAEFKLLPSSMSKAIKKIEAGKRYFIVTELNNWIKISDNIDEGWILKNKISKELPKVEDTKEVSNNAVENNEIQNTTANEVSNNVVENKVSNNTVENKASNNESNTVVSNDTSKEENKLESRKTGKINVDTAKVREKASTDSENIDLLDYDDIVTIVGEEGDFYKIIFEDISGYVSKRLITIVENTSSRSLTSDREKTETNQEEKIEEVNLNTQNEVATSNSNGKSVVEYAKKYLGYSYVVGGKTPENGFDCSGFTKYIYQNFGYNLPSVASEQTSLGDEISREELMPGDLMLFQNEEKTKIGHTGIYLGNNEFIHSANPKRGVVIDNINTNSYYNERFVTARRIVK